MTSSPDDAGSRETEIAGGLCPRDLLAMNLDSRTMPEGETVFRGPTPTPAELAEKFPQFEILECLGRGGMGIVYKARQRALDRLVAVKILASERQADPGFAAHFEHEARILAKLNHPNIVTVHDFGEAGGLFYIAMEFVDGVNLRDVMSEGKLDPEQALAIVPPICDALQAAHRQGVVHRDIKPENILLDREGRVKIADFGIAELTGAGASGSMGTPQYMAPEQAGNSARVDSRADIYSLGVVFYEMLTGERPGSDFPDRPEKSKIVGRLDQVVRRALKKNPADRYQTAEDFKTMVQTVAGAPSVPPALPQTFLPPRETPKSRFRRWWWVFLVMALLGPVLGGMIGGLVYHFLPKKYEATMIIEIKPTAPAPVRDSRFFGTTFERLRSTAVLGEVTDKLDLAMKWDVNPQLAVARLKELLLIQNVRNTDLISIRCRTANPQEGQEILHACFETARVQMVASGTASGVLMHESPNVPITPVSPNIYLCLAIGIAGGLAISPIVALLIILLLPRENSIPATRSVKRKRIGIAIAAVGILIALVWITVHYVNEGNLAPDRRALAEQNVLIEALPVGALSFSMEDFTGATTLTLPVDQRSLDRGRLRQMTPNSGQPVRLKNQELVYFRARIAMNAAGQLAAFVEVSDDSRSWTEQSVSIGIDKPGELVRAPDRMDFGNGRVITVTQLPREQR